LEELNGSVNSVRWQNRAPFTVRFLGADVNSAMENGIHYWETTYNLALKKDGWFERVLDAGYRERSRTGTDTNGDPVYSYTNFYDDDGQPVIRLLDGTGKRLPERPPGKEEPPVYRWFSIYKQRDFNALLAGV
jgi:hypothetical protein